MAQSTRPDLSYTCLRMFKRNNEAADLRNINFVLKKVKMRSSIIFYTLIGNRENLDIIGIGYASYKYYKKSIDVDWIFSKDANSSRLLWCMGK